MEDLILALIFFPHTWAQSSVVARIEGKGTNREELVIIGAHEDSINLRNSADRAPGSDDDASGVAVVLEVYRVLVENGFVPSRTIEFHTYAAEEVGLRGSLDIASSYQRRGLRVVGMLQMDMTMYHGTANKMGVVTDFVNAELTGFLRQIITNYADIGFVDTRCGYGCSDHASWTRSGFPACFPFETDFRDINQRIHTVNDLIDILDIEHGLEFAKVALGFLVELS